MKQFLSSLSALLLCLVLVLLLIPGGQVVGGSSNLAYEEAQTVYLGNLARRDAGVPPLRWNTQLTEAARWFAWDSVENRPEPYCGHQDTNGQWPGDRAWNFGYRGSAGAENAFCGYVTPEQAIAGWLDSPGHRANLLNPDHQEIGLGYYRRDSDGRGYVAQKFGMDAVAPPVIIDNEAISTTDTAVELYIHHHDSAGSIQTMGTAVQMRLGHEPCLDGVTWEPYVAEKPWTLPAGEGWRTVYVQSRDALDRTVVVSDTIYLGQNVPLNEIGLGQTAGNQTTVTLYGLDASGWPEFQLSPGWVMDDSFDTFTLWWGNGQSVNDANARGGTAFRLEPGAGESFAWVWTTAFIKEQPMVAYFRLKVNDNSAATEVARISVEGGGVEYGPLALAGTDFDAADVYQEFALPFTFRDNPDEVFLTFNFWRSGGAQVYVDGVTIFTAGQPVTSPYTWQIPGENYRGQGIWVRYHDDHGHFSDIQPADLGLGRLQTWPASLTLLAGLTGAPPPTAVILVQHGACFTGQWQAQANVPWLVLQPELDRIQVLPDLTGLETGVYAGEIVVEAVGNTAVPPVTIPVTLTVVEMLRQVFLPVIQR